jgi:hypothetical protein
VKRILAASAAAAAMLGPTALTLTSATTASAATAPGSIGGYQFASNTGQPGLAGSGDTYWRVQDTPMGYSEASQSLGGDGVNLSVTPDAGSSPYADSGVIMNLGTVKSSGLLASDGSLSLPEYMGSANLEVNIYFATNGNNKQYFKFNSDGVYEGLDGDQYVITSDKPVSAATVSADENHANGTGTEIWAWVGIDSTTPGTTTTGYVSAVDNQPLTESSTAAGEIQNAYSGKCLDVRNGDYSNGGVLQQWTCGAPWQGVAGGDQQFIIVNFSNGTSELQAVPVGTALWCVTAGADATDAHLTLQRCGNGAGSQTIAKHGPFYAFPGTGTYPGTALVMDDSGYSTINGTYVIGHTQNAPGNDTNQEWSMP